MIRRFFAYIFYQLYQLFNMPDSNNIITDQHFAFEFGGTRTDCTEVDGLTFQREVVEIRTGNNPAQIAQKVPGARMFSNVVVRRHLHTNDDEWYRWWLDGNLPNGQQVYRDVRINLLNETHEPAVSWLLTKAFPVRVSYAPLTALGSEAMIEEIELACEEMHFRKN
jgi:phage tail-like protein